MSDYILKNAINSLAWRKDSKELEKYRFIHHFIPHPVHRTRARLLSIRAFSIYIFLILISLGTTRLLQKVSPGILGYASNIRISDLLSLTNVAREKAGLNQLRLSPSLSAAAQKKAEDMFKNDYWAHVSPAGKEPWDFILAEKYDYLYAGENLAKNFNDSKDVVDAWNNSPSHKDNLLNKNYDEIGFAVVNGVLNGYETTLVVQMFGRPRNPNNLVSVVTQELLLQRENEKSVPVKTERLEIFNKASSLGVNYSPPFIDVSVLSKIMAVAFAGFVVNLLLIDIWYSARKSVVKYTGHTFVHVFFLLISLIGVLISVSPGIIL